MIGSCVAEIEATITELLNEPIHFMNLAVFPVQQDVRFRNAVTELHYRVTVGILGRFFFLTTISLVWLECDFKFVTL